MFWRFGFHTQSSLDALLERDNFTLEEVLVEEDVLQECKAYNKKLIDYLCQEEILSKLLHYISDEPADPDEKTKYKYPSLSAEVFGCEVTAIYDALIANEHLLTEFWKFTLKPAPVNPILGSYFSRVISLLLQKKTAETIAFIQKQDKPLEHLLDHIGTSSILDLVLKLAAAEETPDAAGTIEWLKKQGLVPMLASKFDPKFDTVVHSNASQAIIDLLNTAHSVNRLHVILPEVKSAATLQTILDYMLQVDAPTHASVLQNGLQFFTDLIQRSFGPDDTLREDLAEMITVIEPKLGDLYAAMTRNFPATGDLVHTSFATTPHLGTIRLRLLEFFAALMHTNHVGILQKYLDLKIIPAVIDLFFEYQWNNFLHSVVHDMIVKILNCDFELADEFVLALLRDSRFTERIVEVYNLCDAEREQPKGTRRGYMGHLTLLANKLVKFSQREDLNPEFKVFFMRDPWREFERTTLAETNKRDNRPLGGHRPVHPTELDGPDAFSHSLHDSDVSADQVSRFLIHQVTGDMPGLGNDFDYEAEMDEDGGYDMSAGVFQRISNSKSFDDSDEDDEVVRKDIDSAFSVD